MEDLFKKFLYTGVGLVSVTAEKLQNSIDELVEKGKLSGEEGRKVVDELVEDSENVREDMEGRIRGFIEAAMAKFDFPTRAEVDKLEAKIEELEMLLAKKKGSK